MSREVDRYRTEYIDKHRAFGELGHPDTPSINLERVSHRIVGLVQDGTVWNGKALIMEEGLGKIAKGIIDMGGQLGVSSRGMGSLKNVDGVNIVQDDFYLATAGDLVADPSAPGAFVQGIMENKEWLMVNGIWTEMDQSRAKQAIKSASRKQIEEISLKIFQNIVKKL